MNSTVILLVCISLALLGLGFWAWVLTSSKPVVFYSLMCSTAILFAGYFAATRQQIDLSWALPFLAAMAFAGRGGGMWWRSRKEPLLRLPASLLLCNSLLSLGGAVAAFLSR